MSVDSQVTSMVGSPNSSPIMTALQIEHTQEWLMHLRSNLFAQAKGRLKTFLNEFCCLGLGCEISRLGKWVAPKHISGALASAQPQYEIFGSFAFYDGMWPSEVAEYFGINNVLTNFLPESHHFVTKGNTTLADLNDGGLTFSQIADVIEYYYQVPPRTFEQVAQANDPALQEAVA